MNGCDSLLCKISGLFMDESDKFDGSKGFEDHYIIPGNETKDDS